MLTKSRIINRL